MQVGGHLVCTAPVVLVAGVLDMDSAHLFGTDGDELVARILSCIDLHLDGPQELGLFCIVPRKSRETVVALEGTLDAINDVIVRFPALSSPQWLAYCISKSPETSRD